MGIMRKGVGRSRPNHARQMAFRDTWHRALVYFGLAEDHDYGPEYEEDFEPETGTKEAFEGGRDRGGALPRAPPPPPPPPPPRTSPTTFPRPRTPSPPAAPARCARSATAATAPTSRF